MTARSSRRATASSIFRRRSLRALIAASVTIGAVAVTASSSAAMRADVLRHLRLLRASPAADSTVAASPDAIRLWLSEPTEAPASKIALANAAGAAVPLQAISRAAAKDAPLVAKLAAPLPAGAYKVTWKAMSKDGHVVNGTYGFTVGAAK